MKINRNNYEIFFIDFYDGRVTDAGKHEMELFLAENPDLKEEFDAFENITIDSTIISYTAKQDLKKQEIAEVDGLNEDNYENAFIAWYENDLIAKERASLLSFLSTNQQLEKEFKLHATLKLKQDNLVFESKEILKKKAYIAYYWYGVAAALLMLFAVSFFLNQNKSNSSRVHIEIAHLPSITIEDEITEINVSVQPVWEQRNSEIVELPALEHSETEPSVTALTSIKPSANILEQNLSVYYIDKEYTGEKIALSNIDAPKKRGLLAQFFRKNVEDVTENLGINNALSDHSVMKKKDPGFVKFLDGSLVVFNTITGSDTELVKNYDNEGNLRTYTLEGQTLIVNRKLPSSRTAN